MSIKRFFQVIGAAVLAVMVLSGGFLFMSSKKVQFEVEEVFKDVLPALMDFSELRTDVIQIQQYMTDASLTRDKESLEEAKKYYHLSKEIVKRLKSIHTDEKEVYNDLVEFEKNLDEYYKLSLKMVNAYWSGGVESGNKVMKEVDVYSSKLSEFLEKYVKEHRVELKNIIQMIDEHINKSSITTGVIFALLLLFIGGAMLYIYKRITTSLESLNSNIIDLVEGEGDLTRRIEIKSNDEIGAVAKNMNRLLDKLQGLINELKVLSSKNARIANELAVNSNEVEKRIIEESMQIKEADEALKKVSDKVMHSTEFAVNTKEDMINTTKELDLAQRQVELLTEKVVHISSSESELAHRVKSLSDEAQNVKSILDVIKEIADQTNLLALNAAIEAARAGEHGRGFAVVADEVRNLAEKTQKSLSEIDATLNLIVKAIIETSDDINRNSNEIIHLSDETKKTHDVINSSVVRIKNSVSNVETIVVDFEEVEKLVKDVITKMDYLLNISTQNTRSIEEINEAIKNLDESVLKLDKILRGYKS